MKKIFFGTFAVCLFFFVLCFPRESFEAARSGLLLWYGTLLPSLLPAMILSRILLDSGIACRPVRLLFGPAARLLSLSPYGVYAMAVGFLCGCPMGIKVLSDLRRTDQISREEAVYLADRVIVLSSAGADSVQDILPIELERPRHVYDEAFVEYRRKILGEVQKDL